MEKTTTTAQTHGTAGEVGNDTTDGFVLSRANIGNLPNGLRAPEYDLASVTPGVLHIGPGNFFLAHMASYLQDVLATDPTWGVVVASLRTPGMTTALRKQDNLYVLVERENGKRTATVMAPIVESLFAPDDPSKVVGYIADPRIRIVSLTISNAGYCLKSGGLDLTKEDVLHDLGLPELPKTIYGFIAKGLIERRKAGKPLVIMSLDNVERNSSSLKTALLQFLTQIDAELAAWTEQNVDFPVTLVDRITPEVTDQFRHETREALGFRSTVVVGTESFRELVVESVRFPMPAWGASGVKTVEASKSGDHWKRKFFCLNAGHQVPGIAGVRKGTTFVYQAMAHTSIAALLERYHAELLSSIITEGDAEELAAYCAKIRGRFADPAMDDTVARVVARTTSKVSERLLSGLELGLQANGKLMTVPTFITAIWLHNLGGENEFGEHITAPDAEAPKLQEVHRDVMQWVHAHEDDFDCANCGEAVKGFLIRISEAIRDPRFARVAQNEAFVQLLGWSLVAIHQQGIDKAIDSLLAR